MTQTPNLTSEQKEKNQKYILDNLDEFVFDEYGNFIEFADPDSEYYLIPKEAVSNFEEIIKAIFSMILQSKEDWEVVKVEQRYFVINRRDGRRFVKWGFGEQKTLNEYFFFWNRSYQIIGELGYREGDWKDYEKRREEAKKAREQYEEIEKTLQESRQWRERRRQEDSKNDTNKNQTKKPNPKKEKNKPDKSNFPSPSQDKPTNPPPSPTEIQNQYNSDKDKEEINNSPNLTNPEQKQQAQELLKIIITAELLIKEKQFDPEILSKLLTEKEKNTPIYQIINQEGRGEKAINQLESIKNSQPSNNNNNLGGEKDNNFPTAIIFGSLLLATIVGLAIAVLIKKRRSKWIKPKQKI